MKFLTRNLSFLIKTPLAGTETTACPVAFRNLGGPLQYNLVIAAIFYDAQDNMVNFGDFYESSPENITGDQLLDFEICADAFNREIAHYDLRAWGQ